MNKELYQRLKEAVSHLPIDKFVTVDSDGACYVDWNTIEAADFKDNADAFARAMTQIKCLQLNKDY